jgi:hypothetical protein
MVDGKQHDGRGETYAPGGPGDLGEQDVGAGIDAEQVEVMLADPCRVEPDRLGPQRLLVDLVDELLGAAPIIRLAVVAQGEIAEIHRALPETGS